MNVKSLKVYGSCSIIRYRIVTSKISLILELLILWRSNCFSLKFKYIQREAEYSWNIEKCFQNNYSFAKIFNCTCWLIVKKPWTPSVVAFYRSVNKLYAKSICSDFPDFPKVYWDWCWLLIEDNVNNCRTSAIWINANEIVVYFIKLKK